MSAFQFGDRVRAFSSAHREKKIGNILDVDGEFCTIIWEGTSVGWAILEKQHLILIGRALIEELLTHPHRFIREKAQVVYELQSPDRHNDVLLCS